MRNLYLDSGVMPEPLRKMPVLSTSAGYYLNIYRILDRSRTIGMAEYFIPLSEIQAYCELAKIDSVDERMELLRIITRVDSHCLAMRHKDGKP